MNWRETVTIRKQHRSAMSNAGWAYDAYPELEVLNAHSAITLADIKGPAVITCIHLTQHFILEAKELADNERKALATRGLILEVYYNGSELPAVRVPLGDFFADGCGGQADHFTTLFVEKAPESYNCFIPMPFEISARVVLRNETSYNLMDYAFVEYEQLPAWEEELGYFHATWKRMAFQLTAQTDQHYFHVYGCGHLLGRAWSVRTDEPLFTDFAFVMEGNNEVRIDDEDEPRIDYLGTEDSFGHSWGFQQKFCGLYNGINYVERETPCKLSIYRFFGSNAIRFTKNLDLRIDWSHEFRGHDAWLARLLEVNQQGGGWIDYATTYYWYQENVGYNHEPLLPLEERIKPILRSNS